jgi:translation initiation factor 2-alpha kinase 4
LRGNLSSSRTQGKGGFGSVVKARNKLDGRIYAIKKIKLRGTENDDKIFREINALSRLNHRYIVRYYATWLETVNRNRRGSVMTGKGWGSVDDDDDDDDTTDSDATPSRERPRIKAFDENNILMYNMDDLTLHSNSRSGRSFPSIHFGEETSSISINRSEEEEDDEEEDDDDDSDETSETEQEEMNRAIAATPRPIPRVLYIQMVSLI